MTESMLTIEQSRAFNRAAVLCSKSEYCSSEILDKLKSWGTLPADAIVVVEKLTFEKYIDDKRFAMAYVKDKFRFNRWGRQKIIFMLKSKNICAEFIEQAFDGIEEESYSGQLKELLENKLKLVKATDRYEKRIKLMRFAVGRGFEPDLVGRVLRELGV